MIEAALEKLGISTSEVLEAIKEEVVKKEQALLQKCVNNFRTPDIDFILAVFSEAPSISPRSSLYIGFYLHHHRLSTVTKGGFAIEGTETPFTHHG